MDLSWVFTAGSGELFQLRSAVNTAFNDAVASIEYAVSVLGTSLGLVMGHSGCGAVKAAMGSNLLTPLLEELVQLIRDSLTPVEGLEPAIKANVRNAVQHGRLSVRSSTFYIASGQLNLL